MIRISWACSLSPFFVFFFLAAERPECVQLCGSRLFSSSKPYLILGTSATMMSGIVPSRAFARPKKTWPASQPCP